MTTYNFTSEHRYKEMENNQLQFFSVWTALQNCD